MRIVVAYRAIDGIAGGVERMATALMNEMCARGHEVHFYTIDRAAGVSYYEMDKRITWHKLDMGDYREKAGWWLRVKRAVKSRSIFKAINPDVILAFQDGAFLSCRAYTAFMGVPVVLAERVSPQHFGYTKRGRFKRVLYQLYRFAAKITIQCESYRRVYPAFLRKKIVTISNPVFPVESFERRVRKKKVLLCVGRLGYQKNQTILVKAFLGIAADFPDWILQLAGDGEAFEEIKDLAHGSGQIEVMGAVKDVGALYRGSDVFCLPSRWEGFPNALAEALAHGLPAVGFAECGGVRDLVEDGANGILAQGSEDQECLQEALVRLMIDEGLRLKMGENAAQSVKKYAPDAVFDRWEALLSEVVKS